MSVGIVSTNNCTSEAGAIHKKTIIKNDPGRVSTFEKEILGTTYVGTRLLYATVVSVTEETVRQYIENQKTETRDENF